MRVNTPSGLKGSLREIKAELAAGDYTIGEAFNPHGLTSGASGSITQPETPVAPVAEVKTTQEKQIDDATAMIERQKARIEEKPVELAEAVNH